jgi:hypothetical protein
LLRGQRLRTANQGASCGALQLEKFNPSDWKGPGRWRVTSTAML